MIMKVQKQFGWVWQVALIAVTIVVGLIVLAVRCNAAPMIDEKIRSALVWSPENQHIADTISDVTVTASIAAPFAYALFQEDRWRRTAFVGGITGLSAGLNQIVKWIVGRSRPNGEDNKSFYSGHTNAAFTGIGLLTAQTKYGVWFYPLAFVTAYSRIAADKHWATDVAVGALEGSGFAVSFKVVF